MSTKKKRILLVDDDTQILESLRVALCEKGYEILLASDGLEGLVRAERDAPDLIVLDMMMPKRSGFHVLDRLRSNPHPIRTPKIIMITANESPRHKEYAESKGVDAFFEKPFDMPEFVTKVAELLG